MTARLVTSNVVVFLKCLLVNKLKKVWISSSDKITLFIADLKNYFEDWLHICSCKTFSRFSNYFAKDSGIKDASTVIVIIMKMFIVQSTQKNKNKNTHAMNELGVIGTHELYHKINVFTVKAI